MLSKLPPTVDPLKYTLGQMLLSSCKIKGTNLENNMGSGITSSWFAKATKIHGQTGKVFIKQDNFRNLQHEVAAYHVARLSGIVDVVPCTIRLVHGLKERWAEETDKLHKGKCVVQLYLKNYERTESDTKQAKDFYRRCRLFDYLINNGDRHGGNVMSYGEHYVAIDNAFAFFNNCNNGPQLDNLKFKKFSVEIERLRSSPVLDFLMPLLDSEALKSFVKRIAALTVEVSFEDDDKGD